MGNSSSRNNDDNNVDPSNALDDFEPIDKPSSPSFMSGGTGSSSNNVFGSALGSPPRSTSPNTNTNYIGTNDLGTSGVLVEMTDDEKAMIGKRRIVKASAATASTPVTSNIKPSANAVVAGGSASNSIRGGEDGDDEDDDEGFLLHHELPVTALGKSQQSDTEILQESLTKDRQERMHKLQTDQKSKRNKAVEERRRSLGTAATTSSPKPANRKQVDLAKSTTTTGGGSDTPDSSTSSSSSSSSPRFYANPFSRFLSVFSVEPQFPKHKRRYEPSPSESEATASEISLVEPKRPKLDPTLSSSSGGNGKKKPNETSGTLAEFSATVVDWLDAHLPAGWPWMAAAIVATTVLGMACGGAARNRPKSSQSPHKNSLLAASSSLSGSKW